VIYPLS